MFHISRLRSEKQPHKYHVRYRLLLLVAHIFLFLLLCGATQVIKKRYKMKYFN